MLCLHLHYEMWWLISCLPVHELSLWPSLKRLSPSPSSMLLPFLAVHQSWLWHEKGIGSSSFTSYCPKASTQGKAFMERKSSLVLELEGTYLHYANIASVCWMKDVFISWAPVRVRRKYTDLWQVEPSILSGSRFLDGAQLLEPCFVFGRPIFLGCFRSSTDLWIRVVLAVQARVVEMDAKPLELYLCNEAQLLYILRCKSCHWTTF